MEEVKLKLEELKEAMKDEGILGSDTKFQRLNQYLVDQLEESITDDEAHSINKQQIQNISYII